jgi:hypothetical protein
MSNGGYTNHDDFTRCYYSTKALALKAKRKAGAEGCTGPNGESMGPKESNKYPGMWYLTFWK